MSEFELQLPLVGDFVSQGAETSGAVRVESRADRSVWIILENFRTGNSSNLRIYLLPDPLVQTSDGFWSTSGPGYEMTASIDPSLARQEIEVSGAVGMPAMHTLSVRDYFGPGSPTFGSAALSEG